MEEPFQSAICCLEDQLKLDGPLGRNLEFDWASDGQSGHWSDRMKTVMACMPDKVAYQVVITSCQEFAAVGIGTHWQSGLKAAYLYLGFMDRYNIY